MDKKTTALSLFASGNTCSQSVLCAYADDCGLQKTLALKLACPFGGGIGCTGDLCGAYTGAVMVIGLKHGRVDPKDSAARHRADQLVQELKRRFCERNGGKLTCNDLLGCDRGSPEGVQFMKDHDLHNKVCTPVVASVMDILNELLEKDL